MEIHMRHILNNKETQLSSITIAPRKSANLIMADLAPSTPFQPTSISLEGDLDNLFICDVKVGRYSQNLCAQCIPATLFDAARSPLIEFDLVSIHANLEINLYNDTDIVKEIKGSVNGTLSSTHEENHGSLCGLGSHVVNPGNTIIFIGYSQIVFQPLWLHIPLHLLESFTIDSIELVRTHTVDDAQHPKPKKLDVPILLDAVNPSLLTKEALSQHLAPFNFVFSSPYTLHDEIKFRITNHSTEKMMFSGVLIGPALRSD